MEIEEKDELKQLRDRLAITQNLVWDKVDPAERAAIFAYGDHYQTFLDRAKTEREAVTEIVRQAQALGFVDLFGQASRAPRVSIITRARASPWWSRAKSP